MNEQIDGFSWDLGNIEKCQKHGVSIIEIESVFVGTLYVFPDIKHSRAETRYLAIGKTPRGRHIFLAFTIRRDGKQQLIRPISARYMHQKEIKHYETQITKTDQ